MRSSLIYILVTRHETFNSCSFESIHLHQSQRYLEMKKKMKLKQNFRPLYIFDVYEKNFFRCNKEK